MRDVALTDVCDFQGGTQPPKSEWSTTERPGYIRMLQIRDFTQSNEKYIEYVRNKSSLKTCTEKDILIGRYGASIGKILTGLSGAYNVAMVKTIPNTQLLDTKFLLHLLKSSAFQNFILNIGSRAAQAGFNKKDLAKFRFRLPILTVQKQIAAILDAADSLRQKDQQLVEHYTALSQSLFLEMFGNPVSNLLGWHKDVSIKYCKCIVPGRDKPKAFTGEIPWLTTSDLNHLGYCSNSNQGLGLTAFEIETVRAKVIPKCSVILTCVGDLGTVSINTKPVVVNQQLHTFQCDNENISPVFMMYALSYQTPYMYKMSSSTTVPYMNKTICNNIPMIYPPINLQNQFTERVAIIEKQKKQAQANLKKSEALFNSLLQRAFTGELTADKAA